MNDRNNMTNINPEPFGCKEKFIMIVKKPIIRGVMVLAFILIIGITVLATISKTGISAAELVVEKLGSTPHSAEITVLGESKVYKLVGKDLDALMVYFSDLKLRRILLADSTSFSARNVVGENYSINIKTNRDNSGNYKAQTMYLIMGSNGKLYLRLHLEDSYRITEPDSLKGLYGLLKNMEARN